MAEPNSPSQKSVQVDDQIDLQELFAQLLARAHWVIVAALLGAIIGWFRGQLPPNVFEASTMVQVESSEERIPLPSELVGNLLTGFRENSDHLATEILVIRSRLVLQPVVEKLNAQTVVIPATMPWIGAILQRRNLPIVDGLVGIEYARAGESIEAAIIDATRGLASTRFDLRILDRQSYIVKFPGEVELQGTLGQPLSLLEGGALLVTEINAPAGREYTIFQEPARKSVDRISSGLSIQEIGTTNVLRFSFRGAEPRRTVAVLNAIVEEYMSQDLNRRSVEIDRSIDFIEEQLRTTSQQLQEATTELSEFQRMRQINELSVNTQQLLDAAVAAEARLEELSFKKDQLLEVLTGNHPEILTIEAEEANITERLRGIQDALSRVPQVEQELARLVRRVERQEFLEQQLTERIEQLRVVRAGTVGNIRVLGPAETARLVGPDRRTPVAIGAAAGLVLSMTIIWSVNLLRRGVEGMQDLEKLGLPLFATVNKVKGLKGVTSASDAYGLALKDQANVAVESIRALRTGVKYLLSAKQTNSLMVTSCEAGDGKSFIALNLAIVTGKSGARVLLIDADLRRGQLRRYFGVKGTDAGLSEWLSGTENANIQHMKEANIDFLSTGRLPLAPAELLESEKLGALISELGETYDFVIVDAPPALAVSDPAIIGANVGMTLLVVRHLHTTPGEIVAAERNLAASGVSISGVVLNQFDEARSRYRSYGQKYGYYFAGYRNSYRSDV